MESTWSNFNRVQTAKLTAERAEMMLVDSPSSRDNKTPIDRDPQSSPSEQAKVWKNRMFGFSESFRKTDLTQGVKLSKG